MGRAPIPPDTVDLDKNNLFLKFVRPRALTQMKFLPKRFELISKTRREQHLCRAANIVGLMRIEIFIRAECHQFR
jgi:hypothetical protein